MREAGGRPFARCSVTTTPGVDHSAHGLEEDELRSYLHGYVCTWVRPHPGNPPGLQEEGKLERRERNQEIGSEDGTLETSTEVQP
jgi:hypothetical protein